MGTPSPYQKKGEYQMVISDKAGQANRQNAQHSTGPKTPEGKAAIRFNALTYGPRTRATILPTKTPRTTPGSMTNWQPTGNPKTAPNGFIWKPWSPPNGCSRELGSLSRMCKGKAHQISR
jgi:hypothetical protein